MLTELGKYIRHANILMSYLGSYSVLWQYKIKQIHSATKQIAPILSAYPTRMHQKRVKEIFKRRA